MSAETEEWSVAVDLAAAPPYSLVDVEDAVDDLLDVLAEAAAAVSLGSTRIEVRVDVFADSPLQAADRATKTVTTAVRKAGLDGLVIRRIEATTTAALDADLEQATVPALAGIAEVAQLLQVSRQRASELARAGHFPPPVAQLASGPVWAESTILRFTDSWDRRPGRPSRDAKEVTMAGRRTSARAAKAASSVMRDGRTSSKSKTAAASALSQRSRGKKK